MEKWFYVDEDEPEIPDYLVRPLPFDQDNED